MKHKEMQQFEINLLCTRILNSIAANPEFAIPASQTEKLRQVVEEMKKINELEKTPGRQHYMQLKRNAVKQELNEMVKYLRRMQRSKAVKPISINND
jgi:hypothetical protein